MEKEIIRAFQQGRLGILDIMIEYSEKDIVSKEDIIVMLKTLKKSIEQENEDL